jgi:hypothetical protein
VLAAALARTPRVARGDRSEPDAPPTSGGIGKAAR